MFSSCVTQERLSARRIWSCLYLRRWNRLLFCTVIVLGLFLVISFFMFFSSIQTAETKAHRNIVTARYELSRENTQKEKQKIQGKEEKKLSQSLKEHTEQIKHRESNEEQQLQPQKPPQPQQQQQQQLQQQQKQQQQLQTQQLNVPIPLEKPAVVERLQPDDLIKRYRVDFSHTLPAGQSPWQLAEDWVNSTELLPDLAPQLGAVLREMATARITFVDDGGRGKGGQLKLFIQLAGGQWAIFKPKWYARDFVWKNNMCDMHDLHNAEIAAFHLSRVLGFRKTPLAVGRILKLSKEVKPVATENLLETFWDDPGTNETCFHGHCGYCPTEPKFKGASICTSNDTVEGVMILWLPDSATLNDDRYHNTHPWGRICYDKENVTRLTQNKTYCSAVQNSKYQPSSLLDKVPYPNPFHNNHDMFLDLVDSAILHYIITNADRKTNWVNNGIYQNLFVMLDNGKSFQDPGRDEWLLLAPLFQCCRVRQTTYERLRVLEKGVLSSVMREVLKADPVSPVLTDPHLTAMDRRLAHVILEIQECARTQGPSHVFR